MTVGTVSQDDQAVQYWQYEFDVATHYVAPLLRYWGFVLREKEVIDVGCGEGGGVCSFHDFGARCVGFDIDQHRIDYANTLKGEREIVFALGSLYEQNLPFADRTFDLVSLHDVFEHLNDKEEMLTRLRSYCKPGGKILITFPPYYSPYGAHQQLLQSTIGKFPFSHLIPFAMKFWLPRLKNEHPSVIEEIQKLGTHRMGMKSFERIVSAVGMRIDKKQAYLIGPNHIRFGLKPIPAGPLANVPWLREFVCTGVLYLLDSGR
jgi:SAM-dependent methyltransferase